MSNVGVESMEIDVAQLVTTVLQRLEALEKSAAANSPKGGPSLWLRLLSQVLDLRNGLTWKRAVRGFWIAYGCWLVKQRWPAIRKLVHWLLERLLPGFRYVRTYVTGKLSVKVDQTRMDTRQTVLESVRDGSLLTPMSKAKSQVLVGQMRDGEFHAHGCGIRMETFLVTPDHVWSYPQAEGQTGSVWIMGHATGAKAMEVTDEEAKPVDTDLVYVSLAPKIWSQVGASSQTICHLLPEHGVYACITGPAGLGSTGTLRHDSTVFGRVVYEGSTTGGFSGAPYMVSNQVAGIHQRGGIVNGGYAASYVWITICHLEGMKGEATEDWLQNSFKGKKRVKIDRSWADLDTVRIQVGGQYAIVERSSMRKVLGANWQEDVDSIKIPRELGYEDSTLESGEVMNSKKPGASSIVVKAQEELESPILVLTTGFKQLSAGQQREALRELLTSCMTTSTPSNRKKLRKLVSSFMPGDTSEDQQS